jgi:hypothetical protein
MFLKLSRRRARSTDGHEFFQPPPGPTEAFAALPLSRLATTRAMDMISTAEIDERDPDVAAVIDDVEGFEIFFGH